MKKKVFAIIAIVVVMAIAASVMLTGCVGDNNIEQDKISASAEALGMTALGSGAILADMAEGVVAPEDEADAQQPEAGTEIPRSRHRLRRRKPDRRRDRGSGPLPSDSGQNA